MGKSRMMGAGNASATLYKSNVNLNTGGGYKKQGITSRVGLNNWGNHEVQTHSNGVGRFKLVCMNQLGGVGKGMSMFGGSADGTHCKNEVLDINHSTPVPGRMKAVFLLNLSTTTNIASQKTLNYYWLNYPEEFTECPIVDNEGSLDKTLQLLDEYYGYGFKYFISFQTSTILKGVLESNWFNFHPDAIGISPTANSNSLNFAKNVYRFLPDNSFIINSISEHINHALDGGFNIYYIYSENELVCEDALRILNQTIGNYPNFVKLGTITSDFDTTTKIQDFLSNAPNGVFSSSDILITLIFDRKKYLNLYDQNLDSPLTFQGQQYDILASGTPIIPIGSQEALSNKYNVSLIEGINTSILWRNGYNSLGSNYSTVTLNILTLLNQFANNQSIDNINSHYGILEFDPVTKDLLYPSILIETFIGNKFTSKSLYLVDPILGPYNATFENPSPTIYNIPTPSYKPFGKAIALFELTNYINNIDTIFNDSLYYYWNKNSNFPKFPIVDTEYSIPKTLELLDLYYSQGYRIFLGFSRSSVLSAVVDWFNNHDAVGISLLSTAISLNTVSRNIYRTNPSDDTIVDAVMTYLPKTAVGNVYYIYTVNETATEDVLSKLQNNTSITLLTYPVAQDNSNLTVTDLQNFFTGASANDAVVIYLFDNQTYYDLYNSPTPLTFSGNQYDILNTQLPSINGTSQSALNDKLFYIQNTYPNTSSLWRENYDYLTVHAGGTITKSAGLANALSMIDYFKKGKNIGLLASYSAVLQFNQYKDIEYPTFLFRKYQEAENAFVESSISFDDPLLGNFQGVF